MKGGYGKWPVRAIVWGNRDGGSWLQKGWLQKGLAAKVYLSHAGNPYQGGWVQRECRSSGNGEDLGGFVWISWLRVQQCLGSCDIVGVLPILVIAERYYKAY